MKPPGETGLTRIAEMARKDVLGLSKLDTFGRAADLTGRMERQQAETSRLLDDLAKPARAKFERDARVERERVEREVQALQLSAQIVEQQRLLVETQRETLRLMTRQEQGAERDRIFDRAVLLVAVIAVVVPTVTTVAVASHSWGWSFFTAVMSSIALGLLCMLVTSERRKRDAS